MCVPAVLCALAVWRHNKKTDAELLLFSGYDITSPGPSPKVYFKHWKQHVVWPLHPMFFIPDSMADISIIFFWLLLLLLSESLYQFNSTPEPRIYLDHEGNRKGDIIPSWGQPNTRVHTVLSRRRARQGHGEGDVHWQMPLSCLSEPERSWVKKTTQDPGGWVHTDARIDTRRGNQSFGITRPDYQWHSETTRHR